MKTKRFLATVLAIVMLVSIVSVPVLAEEAVPTLISAATGDGYTCEDLGILIGTGDDGVTEDYLDTLAMRTQAAMINLRLLGLEAAALEFDGETTFADAADATEYWQPVLEYLKANPSIGWVGDEAGKFLPNDYITGQAFTKILLVALGYEYGLDFDWETTMDFAAEVGLTVLADKADEDLTVRDLAAAIVEALGMKYNDTTDVTLISKLVADGVIDETAATEAGFEIDEPTMAIINAYPSAINEVTVVMNMDVPEGTVVTLKKGMSGYNVEMACDGSTITLTAGYALPAGDWTVTVGEEAMAFVIEEQTATGFSFGADFVYDTGTQDLMVTLADQYGDAMDLTGCTISVFNSTTGFVFTPDSSAKTVKIDVTENGAVDEEDEISIFVFDPDSGETASNTYAVMETPYLASGTIGEITLGDEDAERLTVGSTGNILDLEGFDQYGNPYEITLLDLISENVQILESNDPVLSLMTIEDGDLVFDADTVGFTTLTFVLPFEAFVASSDMIQVWAAPELTELAVGDVVITEEQVGLFKDESAAVTVDGFDQYGDAISFDGDDDIWFTTTNPSVLDPETDIVVGDDTVTVYPQATGTCTVFVFLNGLQQGSFTVSAEAAAYPFKVTAVSEDVPMAYLPGSYYAFSGTAVTVVDQYNRTISDMSVYSEAGFQLVLWEDDYENDIASWMMTGSSFVIATNPEATERDSDTFTFGIYSAATDEIDPVSHFTFDASLVLFADISSYTLEIVEDLICSNDENWNNYDQMEFYYAKYIAQSIEAGLLMPKISKTALAEPAPSVTLAPMPTAGPIIPEPMFFEMNPYASPFIIRMFTEDGTLICYYSARPDVDTATLITSTIEQTEFFRPGTRFDYPTDSVLFSFDDAEGTAVIKLWMNGEVVAEGSVEVSKAAPAVASITASYETISEADLIDLMFSGDTQILEHEIFMDMMGELYRIGLEELALAQFDIVDQYGVELPWEVLYDIGVIEILFDEIVTDDGIDLIITVMTVDGMIYDTMTVTDIMDVPK